MVLDLFPGGDRSPGLQEIQSLENPSNFGRARVQQFWVLQHWEAVGRGVRVVVGRGVARELDDELAWESDGVSS